MDNLQEKLIEAQEAAAAAAEAKKAKQQEHLMAEFQEFLQMKAEGGQINESDTKTPETKNRGLFGGIKAFFGGIYRLFVKFFVLSVMILIAILGWYMFKFNSAIDRNNEMIELDKKLKQLELKEQKEQKEEFTPDKEFSSKGNQTVYNLAGVTNE